ncbi:MAG TPA: hypothetical protein VFO30_00060 [Chthoniobacterales bacterium]|nr:hypothetical protein [Chthoniobacterales bacterium]
MSQITRAIVGALLIVDLAACATTSRHQFAEPAARWQTRNGQLLYRNANTTLIGDAFVRFTKTGDFELTFWKGPGVTLLSLREDMTFAAVKGALAGPGWSGPLTRAPKQLRGWLGLRGAIISAQGRHRVRYASDTETFVLRF